MSATILDGKQLALAMRQKIAARVALLRQQHNIVPGLGVILAGDDPASTSYVTAKERACAEAGIFSLDKRVPADISETELLEIIIQMNQDPRIHGILVQLPLPAHINESRVIESILPEKDVDGFTPVNIGRMVLDKSCFIPCTPHGIIKMLEAAAVETKGKHAVIVGRSNIVGKPMATLLARKSPNGNATVTICHTGTPDVGVFTRQADILIVAAGRPNTVTGSMVKPGAVVIDVGVNRISDSTRERGFRLAGDVDFESVREKASFITPVPGGVGPMTITMLLYNTVEAAERTL